MNEASQDVGRELLLERERRALLVTTRARTVFAGIALLAIWIVAGQLVEKLVSTVVLVPVVFVSVWLSRALLRTDALRLVGAGGVALDSLVLCALPIIWHVVYTSPETPLLHLLGHQLGLVSFTLIILNAAALRPLYPAVMTFVAVALHVLLATLAVTDPRLANFDGGLEGALGYGIGVGDLFLKPFIVLLGGGALVWITSAARRTLIEVVEREERELRMQQEQMQMVLQAQVSALGQLVAGVEHEVNSPLGAVRSAASTASMAVTSLRDALASDDVAKREKLAERAIRALEGSVALTLQAGERLSEVMATISRFVHLDRAERQPIDIAGCVRDAARLVEPQLDPGVALRVDVPAGLVVEGDGARLSQALVTVIKNAGEAIEGEGAVEVAGRGEGDAVVLEIVDDGRGMSEKEVAALFAIDFASSGRIRARFGLAACRSVIHGHGGEIEFESEPGEGTRVRIRLPRMGEPAREGESS